MSQQKTTCPSCGKGNYTVWDNGSAKCWNCGYASRNSNAIFVPPRRSRFIKEIREYYNEISLYYHSCLSAEHRQWLYARGISDYSINILRLGYCPDDTHITYLSRVSKISGLVNKDNKPNLTGRIIFPFFADGLVTDVWGRSVDPNEKIRYRGPSGSAFTRGSDYAYMHDWCYKPNAYTRVVRSEGLIKTVLSNQYGIACVGYPGTNAYRSGTPEMVNQKQVIIFDNQKNNRRELITSIKREAERYTNKAIGTLPLRNGDKSDIDSYIFTYGIDDYRRVVESALEYDVWKQLVR